MPTKQKCRNTAQNKLNLETIGLILGLLFAYLEYFLDLRAKLVIVGLYWLGFLDCLVALLSMLLLVVGLKSHLSEDKRARK